MIESIGRIRSIVGNECVCGSSHYGIKRIFFLLLAAAVCFIECRRVASFAS